MKEVIVVSKTHLNLGFTDFADSIKKKYLNEFIPSAIDLAKEINSDGDERFVWTTGSWLIKEALESGDSSLSQKVADALKRGDIAPHAMPFTTHTELLDRKLADYGLSIVDKLDEISGRKTIAAKMTDVPGHTIALVPVLAEHGIKLLHIGINTAAAYPEVPECFVWRHNGAEVVVIYASGYGGEFKCPYIDEILYFDNAPDNHGARSKKAILNRIKKLQGKYPGYTVRAGRLDDIAESLWAVRDKLPVLDEEIGDTWIHGVSTDPYKTGAYRTLCRLRSEWLENGSLKADSDEYIGFSDALLCIPEHTWGHDMKMHLGDSVHYDKPSFVKARKKDLVRVLNIFGDIPYRLLAQFTNIFGDKHYRYSHIEESWKEQRRYLDKALNCLTTERKAVAERAISALLPSESIIMSGEEYRAGERVSAGDFSLSVNEFGGVDLCYQGKTLLRAEERPFFTYRSYGAEDFDRYGKQYMRHRQPWAVADNLRPGLKGRDNYPQGAFNYRTVSAVQQARQRWSHDNSRYALRR